MFAGTMPEGAELSPTLERLVAAHAEAVRGIARRRGLDEGEVEEILQDVRIRLWRALTPDAMATANATYVHRCALSAVVDHVRRRRTGRTDSLDEMPERYAAAATTDETLGEKDLSRRVSLALSEMNGSRRPVVRMYLAGYAQAEIQATMGWTEAKTRNLLYRGLTELRMALGRLGVGPEESM